MSTADECRDESGADLVLVNAIVHTCDATLPVAEAVAITRGRICAVGRSAEIRALSGSRTEVVDLDGRMLVPGFGDAHVHPPQGGVEMLRCDLSRTRTREGYRSVVSAWCDAHPDDPWLLGGGWSMDAFPGGLPTAAELDDAARGRPAFLPNRDHHSAWVTTRALELAGVGRDTPDPAGGRIERDDTGVPTGVLHEGAMSLVGRLLPPTTAAEVRRGLLAAQAYLHSLGITAWQDAIVGSFHGFDDSFDAYLDLVEHDQLSARVVGALWWRRDRGLDQLEELVDRRSRADATWQACGGSGSGGQFRAGSVKIMQDGVCETFTAALLTSYLDHSGHETGNCGLSFFDPEALTSYVGALDRSGFQVHVHAIGDRAVREALDALAALPVASRRRARHHLAHLQVVHPDDIPRFSELGVVANFQPLWACADGQMVELTLPFLGEERAGWQYPIGSLCRDGAVLAFGSDWPVSSPDPLAEMHVAVTRREPPLAGDSPGRFADAPFLPGEAVSLGEALRAFTLGSAYVNHLEHETGSITVGKLADLAVIDRDLFSLDASDGAVSDATVLLTMVGGKVVYESPEL